MRMEQPLRSDEQVLALSLSEETALKILEIPDPLSLDKSFPADVPPDHKLIESTAKQPQGDPPAPAAHA